MKINLRISHYLRTLAAAAWLVSVACVSAQPANFPGGPAGGRGGRGGGPMLPPEQMAAMNSITTALSAETMAITLTTSNLVAASYATPKDEAKIVAANSALASARLAWATKASALFAKVQASTNKLNDAAIAQLVASAPGGRGGRGGPGGGGRGFGAPGGGPAPRRSG